MMIPSYVQCLLYCIEVAEKKDFDLFLGEKVRVNVEREVACVKKTKEE